MDEAATGRFAALALACVRVAYLRDPGRVSFERPYGLAWLLRLAGELYEHYDGGHWLGSFAVYLLGGAWR